MYHCIISTARFAGSKLSYHKGGLSKPYDGKKVRAICLVFAMQNGKNHLSSLIACKQTLFIILKILESSTVFYAFTLQSQKVYAFMDLLIDQVARSTRL